MPGMSFSQAETLRVDQQPDGVACLWIDVPGRPINVFNHQLLSDLDAALDHVAAESAIRVLVVRSAKSSGFLAGADLRAFTQVKSSADGTALSVLGQALFDKVANHRVPAIAVLSGPCLGGGLEFALACDYRLVVDQPGTQLGLPEIERGLLPGWGGTQRLPRVVGLKRALTMILLARRLNPHDALRWGLADAVAGSEKEVARELEKLLQRAAVEGKRPKVGLPRRTWGQTLLESNPLGRKLLFRVIQRM